MDNPTLKQEGVFKPDLSEVRMDNLRAVGCRKKYTRKSFSGSLFFVEESRNKGIL